MKELIIFFQSVNSGAAKEEVIRILDFLEKYTNDHCKLEEEIQRKYNYGKYNQQCIQH
ncbi:hypothetical protein [Clostridium saccharoperbutylacetonicum]|uniref:hypothetical protein n=1 Tax=Clostridium saccharoperbutylacetonicum TaxID=36745 RepID=UPI0039EA2C06